MTSHQPQPPVMQNSQTTVVIVNQPMIDPRMHRFSTSRPYLNRGALLGNGCQCYTIHMVLLIAFGVFFLLIGIICLIVIGVRGFIALAVGGILLGIGIYLVHTAKKQFDSLPPDHPDRTKYTVQSNMTNAGIYQTPTVYAMPPMQNQATSYPPTTAGQNYFVPNSGMTSQFVPQPGASSPHNTYRPENDLPPAYSDIVDKKY